MEIKENTWILGLTLLVIGTMSVNIFINGEIENELEVQSTQIGLMKTGLLTLTESTTVTQNSGTQPTGQTSGNQGVISFEEFIPKGVPAIYGEELGISFDQPVESLQILKKLDGELYEDGKLKYADLTPQQQEKYVKIGMSISCEYCCNADYITRPDGKPACGCAHSAAMRGLAMYILKNHEFEMSSENILQELTYWKTMFFPKQMYKRELQFQADGGNLVPTALDEIPDMVGGC
jgi:hypothetical protein